MVEEKGEIGRMPHGAITVDQLCFSCVEEGLCLRSVASLLVDGCHVLQDPDFEG